MLLAPFIISLPIYPQFMPANIIKGPAPITDQHKRIASALLSNYPDLFTHRQKHNSSALMLASALASVEVYIAHLTEKAKTLEPSTPTPDPSPASFVVGDVVTFKGCSQPMTVVKAGNEYNVILISGKNIAQVIKDIPFAALKKF